MITIGLHRTHFYRWNEPVDIDTSKHTAIVGTTGAGKSTILKAMILAEIEAGHGVCVIEPHGSLIDDILDAIPPNRRSDVILYDPGDPDFALGLNPLEGEEKPKLLAESEAIAASVYKDSWGPQTSMLFRNFGEGAIETDPQPTFLHIYKAYMLDSYRTFLARRVSNPTVRLFFEKYQEWDKRQQEQAAAPGTNKLDTFMQAPLRYAVTQRNGLDFERILNGSQILLCRFAKGKIGPSAGAYLGSVVLAKILYAALAREKTSNRSPFRVFVDEAGSFMCGTAHEHILTEARKYGVSMTMGFQTLEQLSPETKAAVFGNIASLLVGRVGASDAEELGLEMGVPPETLQNLNNFWWYAKTVRNGMRSDPTLMEGIRPVDVRRNEEVRRQIRKRTNERYGKRIDDIEANIETFLRGGKHENRISGQSPRPQKAVRLRKGRSGQRLARSAGGD